MAFISSTAFQHVCLCNKQQGSILRVYCHQFLRIITERIKSWKSCWAMSWSLLTFQFQRKADHWEWRWSRMLEDEQDPSAPQGWKPGQVWRKKNYVNTVRIRAVFWSTIHKKMLKVGKTIHCKIKTSCIQCIFNFLIFNFFPGTVWIQIQDQSTVV